MACAAECQFRWGAAEAGQLLGQALMAQDRLVEGMAELEKARSLRM